MNLFSFDEASDEEWNRTVPWQSAHDSRAMYPEAFDVCCSPPTSAPWVVVTNYCSAVKPTAAVLFGVDPSRPVATLFSDTAILGW